MTERNIIFDDLMEALHEVEEHQKGNIKLRSQVVEIPDYTAIFDGVVTGEYNQLPEDVKEAIRIIIDNALKNAR